MAPRLFVLEAYHHHTTFDLPDSLDDVSIENGYLQYIPQSIKGDLLDVSELARNMNGILYYLNEEQKTYLKLVPTELKIEVKFKTL